MRCIRAVTLYYYCTFEEQLYIDVYVITFKVYAVLDIHLIAGGVYLKNISNLYIYIHI